MFCTLFFILFCILGSWQLHRYEFKKSLINLSQQGQNALPKPFMLIGTNLKNAQFQPITVTGVFLNELTILLQNRYYKQKPGFEVLTPLQIPGDKKLLLINRGWIEKPDIQKLATAKGEQQMIGHIKLLDEYQFILGKNILEPNKKPMMIQKIDINEITQLTQHAFYPFVLRLDPAAPNGFIREWVISTTQPERHLMYAIQWFLMAGILVIAYLGFSTERVKQ